MKMLGVFVVLVAALVSGCVSTPSAPSLNADFITEEEKAFFVVLDVPGLKKEQIFGTSKQWIAESFKSSKAVIDYESAADGVIIGNGVVDFPNDGCSGLNCMIFAGWKVPFKVKIDVKDERLRMSFSNLEIFAPASYGTFASPAQTVPLVRRDHYDAVKPRLLSLGPLLVGFLRKSSSEKAW